MNRKSASKSGDQREGRTVFETRKSTERLTVAEFCKEWQVARSTFYVWLAKGEAPSVVKLPNGQLRINRRDIEAWEASHTVEKVVA